jgi:hypothetical protein
MAIPIKETPELKGRNARNFEKEISQSKDNYLTREEYSSAEALMNRVLHNSSL